MQKLHNAITIAIARVFTIDREDGQGAVEYALTVLGVAAVIALAVAGFTGQLTTFMSAVGTKLQSWA
jgi:Flp pilus assembly pilin Flp